MNTWDRYELKENAKVAIKLNYWKTVLAGLIIASVTGGLFYLQGLTSIEKNVQATEIANFTTFLVRSPKYTHFKTGFGFTLLFIGTFVILQLFQTFILNPLEVGSNRFFIGCLSGRPQVREICFSYDNGYQSCLKVLFLRNLYIALWSFLLIVPGIIKSYEYMMVPYILGDQPEISCSEAFALSKKMMYGRKWNAFVLDLSFLLWDILGILTFGIVTFFYVIPYKQLTHAGMYQELKGSSVNNL